MSSLTILRRPRRASLRPARRPITAAATTVALGAIAALVPWRLSAPWWLETALLAALLVASIAAVVDIADQRIPDRVVLASLVPTAVVLVIGPDRPWAALAGVVSGAAAFGLPLLLAHLVSPSALGFGDVKLGGALGAALGLADWRWSVVALCIASGLTAAVALVRRRSTIPFAPGLVVGTALVLVVVGGSPTWR